MIAFHGTIKNAYKDYRHLLEQEILKNTARDFSVLLRNACRNKLYSIIPSLLKLGANPNERSKKSRKNAYDHANGNRKILKLLEPKLFSPPENSEKKSGGITEENASDEEKDIPGKKI